MMPLPVAAPARSVPVPVPEGEAASTSGDFAALLALVAGAVPPAAPNDPGAPTGTPPHAPGPTEPGTEGADPLAGTPVAEPPSTDASRPRPAPVHVGPPEMLPEAPRRPGLPAATPRGGDLGVEPAGVAPEEGPVEARRLRVPSAAAPVPADIRPALVTAPGAVDASPAPSKSPTGPGPPSVPPAASGPAATAPGVTPGAPAAGDAHPGGPGPDPAAQPGQRATPVPAHDDRSGPEPHGTAESTVTGLSRPGGAAPAPSPVPAPGRRPPAPDGRSPGVSGAPPLPVARVEVSRPTEVSATAPAVSPPAVPNQIVSAVVPLHGRGDGRHDVTLELRPEHLGTIRVEVTVERQTVHLTLHAADPATGRILSAALPELRSALAEAGLTAGFVGVGPDGGGGTGAHRAHPSDESSERRPAAGRGGEPEGRAAVRTAGDAGAGRLDLFL